MMFDFLSRKKKEKSATVDEDKVTAWNSAVIEAEVERSESLRVEAKRGVADFAEIMASFGPGSDRSR